MHKDILMKMCETADIKQFTAGIDEDEMKAVGLIFNIKSFFKIFNNSCGGGIE